MPNDILQIIKPDRIKQILRIKFKGIIPQVFDDLFREPADPLEGFPDLIQTGSLFRRKISAPLRPQQGVILTAQVVVRRVCPLVIRKIALAHEIYTQPLVLCGRHFRLSAHHNFIDCSAERPPRHTGVQDGRLSQGAADILKGILNQAHIPPALKGRVQGKNILVRGVHGANDG